VWAEPQASEALYRYRATSLGNRIPGFGQGIPHREERGRHAGSAASKEPRKVLVEVGLAAAALALARVLDNPKAVSTQPAAAKVLATTLDKLRSESARGRRGSLSVVREMTGRVVRGRMPESEK
jgi:hypothetical protein